MKESLEKDNSDEISAWIANYIAEKMDAAIRADGKEKSSAERVCFEAILMLWEYQRCLPQTARPFNEFEPIFNALEHIDPNKTYPSYFSNENGEEQPPEEIAQTMEFITHLDNATRIIISFFVRNAMMSAMDESTPRWLAGIKGLEPLEEAKVIFKCIPEIGANTDEESQNEEIKTEISEHIRQLEIFEGISQIIKSALNERLEKLEKDN